MLAGTGLDGSQPGRNGFKIMVRLGKLVEPQPETTDRYHHGYQVYLSLYQR